MTSEICATPEPGPVRHNTARRPSQDLAITPASRPVIDPQPGEGDAAVTPRPPKSSGPHGLGACCNWVARLCARKKEGPAPSDIALSPVQGRRAEGPAPVEPHESARWWSDAAFAGLSRDTPALPAVQGFLRDFGAEALQTGEMLDVGSADGGATRAAIAAGWPTVHAIDADGRCLQFIQPEIDAGNVHPSIGRVEDLPLPSNQDWVNTTQDVLSFIGDRMQPTLRRFFEATRPGGYLLARFFGPGNTLVQESGGRISSYSQAHLTHVLQDIGYVDIDIRPFQKENFRLRSGRIVPMWDTLIVRARKPEASPTQ